MFTQVSEEDAKHLISAEDLGDNPEKYEVRRGAGNAAVAEKGLVLWMELHGAASGIRTNPQGRQAFRVWAASGPMAPPHWICVFVKHDTSFTEQWTEPGDHQK